MSGPNEAHKGTMKFYETTLETVKVLAINDEEFTLRKMNEDGNVG